MQIPVIRGVIDRRILVNYRVDPDVLHKVLPEPFRPQLVSGVGIGGICLIRLKRVRPRHNFFECGSLGYSATSSGAEYDGLELRTLNWNVEALSVERVESSFFGDQGVLPAGCAEFDCALLMQDVQHEWHGRETLKAA